MSVHRWNSTFAVALGLTFIVACVKQPDEPARNTATPNSLPATQSTAQSNTATGPGASPPAAAPQSADIAPPLTELEALLARGNGLMIQPAAELPKHDADVTQAVLASEGRLVATLDDSRKLKISDAATGALRHEYALPEVKEKEYSIALAAAPRGPLIAIGLRRQFVVYDAEAGKVHKLLTHDVDAECGAILFTADRLIAKVQDTLLVWPLPAADKPMAISLPYSGSSSIAVTPDGATLVTPGRNKTLTFYDLNAGKLDRTVPVATDEVSVCAIDPTGTCLAAGSRDDRVVVYDLKSMTPRAELKRYGSDLTFLSPRLLQVGDNYRGLYFVDNKELRLIAEVTVDGDHAVGPQTTSPDELRIVGAGKSKMRGVQFRLARTQEEGRLTTTEGISVRAVAVSHDAKRVAAFTQSELLLVSLPEGKALATVKWPTELSEVARLEFSADDSQLLVSVGHSEADKRLCNIYSAADLKLLHEAKLSEDGGGRAYFTPDGRNLLVFNSRGSYLWNIAEKKLVPENVPFIGRDGARWFGDAAKKQLQLLTADREHLHLYSWNDRKEIRSWPTGHSIDDWAVSPDGALAATFGRPAGQVFVWNVATGELAQEFKADKDGIRCAAFSPDGKYFITASGTLYSSSGDEKLAVWSTATWEPVAETKVNERSTPAIAFGAAGSDFVTTHSTMSLDRSVVKHWNLDGLLKRLAREPKPIVAPTPEPEPLELALLVGGTPPDDDKKDLQLRRDLSRLSDRQCRMNYEEGLLRVRYPSDQATAKNLGELPILTRPYVLRLESEKGNLGEQVYAQLLKQKNLVGLEFLEATPLSTAELLQLKGLPLRSLIAPNYLLADADAVAALAEFPTLEKLRVSTTHERNDTLDLSPLTKLQQLRMLDFQRFEVPGAALDHLAKLIDLEDLELDGTKLTDDDLGRLTQLSKLRRLRIVGPLTGSGLAKLSAPERLEVLILNNCDRLSDEAFAAVSRFKNLRELDLNHTKLSAKGIAAIAGLTKLERLELPDEFDDAGMVHLAALTKVRELSLWNRSVSDEGLKHLARWTELEDLNVQRCPKVTGAGLAAVAGSKKLKELWLIEMPGLTDEGLKGLEPLVQLEDLWLPPQITDAGLKNLAPLVNLQKLSIQEATLSEAGIAHLVPLTALEELRLSECTLTDAAIPAFAKLSNLKSLYVDKTGITKAGLEQLKKSSPNLSATNGK